MAILKLSLFAVALSCLLQGFLSQSVLGSLKRNGLYNGKLGAKLNALSSKSMLNDKFENLVAGVSIDDFADKINLPTIKVKGIKDKSFLTNFNDKLSIRSLLGKSKDKKTLEKKPNLNSSESIASKVKDLSKKNGKNGNGKLFAKLRAEKGTGKKLGSKPKQEKTRKLKENTLDTFASSLKRNFENFQSPVQFGGQLGDIGGSLESFRERLADNLGLDGRLKFFDGRRGIFDGSLFGRSKELNLIDILDGKLASITSRFRKSKNGMNGIDGKLKGASDAINERLESNRKLTRNSKKTSNRVSGRKLLFDVVPVGTNKLMAKVNTLDLFSEKISDSKKNKFNLNDSFKISKLNPIDTLDGKLASLSLDMGMGIDEKLKLKSGLDAKVLNSKLDINSALDLSLPDILKEKTSMKLNPIDFLDGKIADVKFTFDTKLNINPVDYVDSKLAAMRVKLQKRSNEINEILNKKIDFLSEVLKNKSGHINDIITNTSEEINNIVKDLSRVVGLKFSGSSRKLGSLGLLFDNNGGRFQRLWIRRQNGNVSQKLADLLSKKSEILQGVDSSKFGDKLAEILENIKAKNLDNLFSKKSRKFDGFKFNFPLIGKLNKPIADSVNTISVSNDSPSPVATTLPGVIDEIKFNRSSNPIFDYLDSDVLDNIPGGHGILYAIGLLETGGSLKEATDALVGMNDIPALQALTEEINKLSA